MTANVMLAVASGAVAAAGLVMLIRLFTRPADTPTGPPPWLATTAVRLWRGPGRSRAEQRRWRAMAGAALAAGALTWLVSGLPVLAAVVAAAVPGVPWLLAAGTAERRAIARVEAVGEWTRRLRDVAGIGAGLQKAIVSAAATAPAPIAEPVGMLAARLQAGADARQALLRFADEINDPVCDQIVATLLLHLQDRGDRLGAVLGAITDAASKEVTMRKEADAERASARFSIRFMVVFSVAAVVVAAFAGDYMAPYSSGLGQIVMAVLAAGFVAVLAWVRALTRPVPGPRMLGPTVRGAEE